MPPGVDRVTIESADGTRIHVSVFPTIEPVAALVVVHGLQGHAGWLEASGTGIHLASQGILTFAYDRRGSGRSGGERGHARRRREFLEDLGVVRDLVRQELIGRRNPEAPVHLLANGFGARVGLAYLLESPDAFHSAILTSPATHTSDRGDYDFLDKIRILTARAERRFPIPPTDEDLVGEGVWLDWIRNDQWSLRACTASFLRAAGRLTIQMNQAVGRLTTPLLVLTARDDALVHNEAMERTFKKKYRGPLRLRQLPGDHYSDFTPAQSDYRAALASWILGGWAAP